MFALDSSYNRTHAPLMDIYKDKLPARLSYALKPSELEGLLSERAISVATTLYQWRGCGRLFDATFYPPGQFHLNEHEVLHVGSYAVPSSMRQQAVRQLHESILPEFIQWIESLLAEPTGSTIRRETQRFIRKFEPSEDA